MNRTLYLLWSTQGWGVFDACTCPDTHNVVPPYCYRKYDVPEAETTPVFRKLLEVKERLEQEHIIPTRHSASRIFPDLSELLS